MELRVSLITLVYDIVLLPAMIYIWWFFFKRRNFYISELRPFVRDAVVFLFFAVVGRTLDLLDDFFIIPYDTELQAICYSVSIIGVIYTMMLYVITLERSYIPIKTPSPNGNTNGDNPSNALVGAYIVLGSRGKMFEIIKILKELRAPTIVFTRNPELYKGLEEFVVPIWVTQVSEKGVPPTALHIIQDKAIRFISQKGGSIVVIDCLEYLLIYNDFSAVFKFLVNLKDYIISTGKTFIIFVDENAIEDRQKAFLLKEFEPL
jgi:hypothetical protein